MFRIIFENELGAISMGGGSHPSMNVTDISGFSNPKKELKTAVFASGPGSVTTSARDTARTLTVAGTFRGLPLEVRKIYAILSCEGVLSVYFHRLKLQIKCRCVDGDEFVRISKDGFYRFALQFLADNPYFSDCEETYIPIFSRINKVKSTFTLPCVFTERICRVTAHNSGDIVIYPTVFVHGTPAVKSSAALQSEEHGILITNQTSGAKIHLKHTVQCGETITIDVKNRKIHSDTAGNITNKISDDTVLSSFFLEVGDNVISVDNYDTDTELSAQLSFKNEYRTAVY